MAQFANLPSRLFHIFFGQPPVEGKQHKTGKSRLKNTRRRMALEAKTVTSASFTAIGKKALMVVSLT